jgi:peptidoglycan hydrolase-like protein with peptidoglycan-binding domain
MKKYLLSSLLFVSVFILYFLNSSAQSGCLNLQNSLQFGSKDYFTNGEVTKLQEFLGNKGYFEYEPTGYFGRITMMAVMNLQRDNGLYTVGIVGPLTRQIIYSISCNNIPVPISVPNTNPPHVYYCDIDGQNYSDIYSYNFACRHATNQTYYCSINGLTFPDTNSYQTGCVNPTNVQRYCSLNGQTYNSVNDYNNYCRNNTINYCALNTEYQGGGFVATNDCTCPAGSVYTNTYNGGEIYKWKCIVPATPTTCNLDTEYTFAVIPNSGACSCPTNSTRVDLSNGAVGTNHFKCVTVYTNTQAICPLNQAFGQVESTNCSCPSGTTKTALNQTGTQIMYSCRP